MDRDDKKFSLYCQETNDILVRHISYQNLNRENNNIKLKNNKEIVVSYSFNIYNSDEINASGGYYHNFTLEQQATIKRTLNDIAAMTGLEFVFTSNTNQANIVFDAFYHNRSRSHMIHPRDNYVLDFVRPEYSPPDGDFSLQHEMKHVIEGLKVPEYQVCNHGYKNRPKRNNSQAFVRLNNKSTGKYWESVVLHEICHALGLRDLYRTEVIKELPDYIQRLPRIEDYSIMWQSSFNRLQPTDIIALQKLHGTDKRGYTENSAIDNEYNKITSDWGAENLVGTSGKDKFIYTQVSDSPSTAPDVIYNFRSGIDKIDISALSSQARPVQFVKTFSDSDSGKTEAALIHYRDTNYLAVKVTESNMLVVKIDGDITHSDLIYDDNADNRQPTNKRNRKNRRKRKIIDTRSERDTSLGSESSLKKSAGNITDDKYNEIISGEGGDIFRGTSGKDKFIYTRFSQSLRADSNADIIYDFQSGIDKIDISALHRSGGVPVRLIERQDELDNTTTLSVFLTHYEYETNLQVYTGKHESMVIRIIGQNPIRQSDLIYDKQDEYVKNHNKKSNKNGVVAEDEYNKIPSGWGAEDLVGTSGKDKFIYTQTSDSPSTAPDVLYNFQPGIDKVDISTLNRAVAHAGKNNKSNETTALSARLIHHEHETNLLVYTDQRERMKVRVAARIEQSDFIYDNSLIWMKQTMSSFPQTEAINKSPDVGGPLASTGRALSPSTAKFNPYD